MIPGRKTSENKVDFPCSLQENEKMKNGDGARHVHLQKERIIVLGKNQLP